jgi:4-carboxymuconolactone decarboxylase
MRLPHPTPDELDPEQRALHDAIAGGPRAGGPQLFELVDDQGRLNGPFGVMLHSPAVGGALQELGAAIRYRSVLSDRLREIAILAVAASWSSDFEQYAHEPLGRAAGLTDAQLAALAAGTAVELEDPAEDVGLRMVRAMLSDGDLGDDLYAEGRALLGDQALVELTALVGYYATLALQLRVFRVGVPEHGSDG